MTDQEPKRLKTTGETPEQLVRALNALGRDRDGERLARVATRLSATLAASGAPAGGALSKVFGSKLAVTGLVIGLGVLGLLGYQLTKKAEPKLEERPAVEAPAPLAPRLAPQPAAASTPVPLQSTEHEAVRAPASASDDAHRRSARDEPPRVKRAARAETTASANEAPREAEQPSDEVEQPSDEAEQPSAEQQAQVPSAPEDAKPAAQPLAAAAPPASEELLLYKARKAASHKPSVALRLLDEHAARFPSGLLVPEREVLAIEVLRGLGRNAEAEQRLQRFKARYPKSMHLRRLEQSGSSGDGE